MPDLDQLLDTLVTDVNARTRAPGAPTAIKQAHHRRTKVVAVIVAAAAAVIAGSAVTITDLNDDRTAPPLEQPESTKNPPLTTPLIAPESLLDVRELGFHVEPVGGVEVGDSWGIDGDGQWTDVSLGDDARLAFVKVFYQGRSPQPLTGTTQDITVNGLPGTYTEDVRPDGYTAQLIWQYAPDSWAQVAISADAEPPSDLRQRYVTVAEAVQTGGETLLLPVRFDSAPASLPAIAKADRVTGESSGEWTIYVWVDDVMVSVTNAVDLGECVGDGGEPQTAEFTYRGYRGCVVQNGDQERVVLHLNGVDVTYDFDPSQKLPLEDIKRLLDGVTVVPPSYDLTAWFDLKTALGG